ncbi:DUF1450 domain-containing protein [Alicyclobacillus sp. ALC3]|uniref:DUF1450 domain-containing protein n=1 Tax=Alicyclobacillus sp. ALC3 TaxID=2796143 RepID=UPI0023795221|nr:DUF1450 domain-containing protein [Alicyclobacillus sp. ALC3]WDL95455.1 DUF1450 domain-containing protein [Alicyclobacillus sp. ALC3]
MEVRSSPGAPMMTSHALRVQPITPVLTSRSSHQSFMARGGSMKLVKLELCTKNAPLGSRSVAQRVVAEQPQAAIRQWARLGPCEHCAKRPFLLVNGVSYVISDDADALYEKVCHLLSQPGE